MGFFVGRRTRQWLTVAAVECARLCVFKGAKRDQSLYLSCVLTVTSIQVKAHSSQGELVAEQNGEREGRRRETSKRKWSWTHYYGLFSCLFQRNIARTMVSTSEPLSVQKCHLIRRGRRRRCCLRTAREARTHLAVLFAATRNVKVAMLARLLV